MIQIVIHEADLGQDGLDSATSMGDASSRDTQCRTDSPMTRDRTEPFLARRRQVEALAGYGLPHEQIALVLDIDLPTLRARHDRALARGAAVANSNVARALYGKAIGDGPQSVTAAIFWIKARLGWKETVVSEGTTTIVADGSIAALMQRIAEQGRPIWHRDADPMLEAVANDHDHDDADDRDD